MFKIKRTTPFAKLFKSYAADKGQHPQSIRFFFDDHRINPEETPEDLNMDSEEMVEAKLEQEGGGEDSPHDAQEEVAPEPRAGMETRTENKMTWKVKDHNQNEAFFKIKRNTLMSEVMDTFCKSEELRRSELHFIYKGSRLLDNETPDTLQMKDRDCVDVVAEQLGGTSEEHGEAEIFNIRVTDQKGNELYFRINDTTSLSKLTNVWIQTQGVTNPKMLRFLFDGHRIEPEHEPTPKFLEMADGDVIEVYVKQEGGGDENCDSADEEREESPPQAKPEGAHKRLSITVGFSDGSHETHFKLKRDTRLGRMMTAYADRSGRQFGILRFLTPLGKRLLENDTPDSIGLQGGDIIEATIEQRGGASSGDLPLPSVDAPAPPVTSQDRLNISVQDSAGIRTYFCMRPSTDLKKLMDAYVEVKGISRQDVNFLFRGRRVLDGETGQMLEMADDQIIDGITLDTSSSAGLEGLEGSP